MKLVKDKFTGLLLNTNRVWYKPVLALLCLVAFYSGFAQNIPEPPNPPRLVNDYAHLMTAEQVQQLETKLDRYNDSTSTQIAIVTIESLEGAEVGSYAAELGEKWGVGTKKNHNGVIILLAKKENKVTIRTGYGVEQKLGAIICDRITKNQLTPNFKAGNFYGGFDAATTEMIQRLAGTFQGDDSDNANQSTGTGIPLWRIIAIVFFLILILSVFFRGGGGGFTGGLIGGMIGGTLGAGGWSEGGGGDSGGFGGFGGGGFSGGGASGDW